MKPNVCKEYFSQLMEAMMFSYNTRERIIRSGMIKLGLDVSLGMKAWAALNSTVLKTLEYPLLILTLTEAKCTTIMVPVLTGGSPNMRVCRNMVR